MMGQIIIRINLPIPTEEKNAKQLGETLNRIITQETGTKAEIEYYSWW